MEYSVILLILRIVYAVVLLGCVVALLKDDRPSSKTVAWLFVLAVPFIGIILWYFFGQNIRREWRIDRRQPKAPLSSDDVMKYIENNDTDISLRYSSLMHFFNASNESYALASEEMMVFKNGYEFFPALIRELSKAKSHIHLLTFIFEDDPLGRLVSDVLIDKARAGVEVRVIYDDVGCWKVPNAFFDRMKAAGVEVYPFLPVRFPKLTVKANYRNHRKIFVIDGRTGFIGGMNIALRYVRGNDNRGWRDTQLMMRGDIVFGMQKVFLSDWYFVSRVQLSGERYYPSEAQVSETSEDDAFVQTSAAPKSAPVSDGYKPVSDGYKPASEGFKPVSEGYKPAPDSYKIEMAAQIVSSSPVAEMAVVEQGYMKIILSARRYLYIETPYYIPPEDMIKALSTAVKSGVDVRVITPLTCDSKVVQWASFSYLRQAMESGVKVYMYKPSFLHSKVLVSDDEVVSCGSTNFDFRSMENNFEANAFVYGKDAAVFFKVMLEHDMRQSDEGSAVSKLANPGWWTRLRDSAIRIIAPLL